MAFDAYVKIDGCEGESTSKGMEKQIEIISFSWGATNSVTVGSGAGGISGGKVNMEAFTITKKVDKSSPNLFLAACDGTHYKTITITFRKATGSGGQKPFDIVKLSDCMVESYHMAGSSGGDDTPTETVSFAFGKVETEYYAQKADGSTSKAANTGWDVTKNSKV
jgi:type VI secretion system secreted protein Hcp